MKRAAVWIFLIAIGMSVWPAMAQDIADMEDFVARGYAGTLTDEQIAQHTANWTEQDWHQFYAALAETSGMAEPDGVAAELVAEDRALAGNPPAPAQAGYSAEIPRTHDDDASMRSAHHWQTAQYGCDEDPDVDYQFVFYVSAANVLNVKWYSTNGWIGLIVGDMSGKLKAFGMSSDTTLCIGDFRICLVGGIDGCTTGAEWTFVALKLKP